MFTGIISDIGALVSRDGERFILDCAYDPATIELGASIACDGCCLTVIEVEGIAVGGARFHVDVSNETMDCTILGAWVVGQRVNLERALRMGDELGGHIVTGHVDAVVNVTRRQSDGASFRYYFDMPDDIAPFIAEKGSVTLNGTSLTVNNVSDLGFDVNLIPHTHEVTNWGQAQVGSKINLEVDVIARYVARQSSVVISGSK